MASCALTALPPVLTLPQCIELWIRMIPATPESATPTHCRRRKTLAALFLAALNLHSDCVTLRSAIAFESSAAQHGATQPLRAWAVDQPKEEERTDEGAQFRSHRPWRGLVAGQILVQVLSFP